MRAILEPVSTDTRRLLQRGALAFVVVTVLAVLGASQSQAYFAISGNPGPPWSQSLLWSAAQWYTWLLFAPWIVRFAWRYSFGPGSPLTPRIALHVALAFAFAFAHLTLLAAVLWFLPGGHAFMGDFGNGLLVLASSNLQWELLIYAVTLAGVHVALYLRRAQAEAAARQELQTQTARAQLAALQRQMQPHFLFNALNALVSMQREDSAEQRYTIRLGELLRQLLEAGDRTSATLADELHLVGAYLDIERARLGERLRARVDVPDALRDTLLPAFILQPLVENAIAHGIACDPEGGEVSVQAQRDGDLVRVEVLNAARSGGATRGHGIALDNCRRRLELMYGAKARFEAVPLAHGFRAAIAVPYREAAA